jgi:hypothetical protein
VTAGASAANWWGDRSAGSASTTSFENTCWAMTLRTSTAGASPITSIDSSTAPTRMSMFTVATKAAPSSRPARCTVLKPGSVKVML